MVGFFTPMVFVFGFGFVCSFVLVGSALVSPERVMPQQPAMPYNMVALCRGSLWGLAYDNMAAVIPDAGLGWALLYYAWSRELVPQPSTCSSLGPDFMEYDRYFTSGLLPSVASMPRCARTQWRLVLAPRLVTDWQGCADDAPRAGSGFLTVWRPQGPGS
eukprot:2994445-Prymnesium_polylepis.1